MQAVVANSRMNYCMLVDDHRYYILKARSKDELLAWLIILAGKWVIFNQNFNRPTH